MRDKIILVMALINERNKVLETNVSFRVTYVNL